MVFFTVLYLTCFKLAENGIWLPQTEQSIEEQSIVWITGTVEGGVLSLQAKELTFVREGEL